ncbi:MAG: metallophosphoesterase family protein, partial [Actinomycetes bacterium]
TSVAGEKVGSRALTLVAAGDIARRPSDGRGTARLIASIDPDAVLALGDNAYENGSLSDYRRNYDPTWGRFKKITRPVPGNHEYRTRGAAGYLAYFDRQVDGRSYYAWDAGHWRMYALSCGIDCGAGSRQLAWLRQDLAANADRPALAYVHEPLYTCSTRHPPTRRLSAVWSVLQRADGRIMLAGHNHAYERFAKQDATGRRSADGLRQFVVGTGGVALYPVRSSCRNRLAAQDDTSGVLVLRLGPERFSWRFVAVSGQVLDRGRGRS